MNLMSVTAPASIPSPPADFSSFSLGPLTIHTYALCILAGIILALWMTSVRWKRRGLPEEAVWDIAIWAIPFGIIGGRLYHVVSSPAAYFGANGDLSLIPQIWRGGLGIWGAVALGAVGAWIGCRRAGIKLSTFADVGVPGLLLAQAVGRWGNWFNQELFGSPTDVPWGLEIDANSPNFPDGTAPGTLFHPTFLYESLWCLAGVALLLALDKRFRLRGGRLFWIYAAYYTLGRLWIEILRIDDAEMITFFGVTQRLNVWTSIGLLIFSVGMFIFLTIRAGKGKEGSLYLPGHEPELAVAEREADNNTETESSDSGTGASSQPTRANLAETKNEDVDSRKPGTPGTAK
ncbi:prolipoprotein diacylglyceryl transferase [Arthrobacter gengyunqii]|uniref:Phosphatidylglycerol--prolipoprotein diacylglyceryl transferase n=1 Tax=Arthrobacter gengyunqii TaxID=2886940 RepID=A0ABS8GFE6_9MICC|nr:prolipoprotein diacylglyceryl transferase [Arthrobacter gengyunqii]MCC3264692.1 prolipoprotein diacylglyceryl transferase [Arthrobacter gengyunqii]